MIGIYKYQNKINNKVYIGQSINLKTREYNHKSSAYNQNAKDYNSQFHQAVRKYGGFENFTYEILEIVEPKNYSKEYLDDLEKFYISKYNSYKNGYNGTMGGDSQGLGLTLGEKNGKAILTEEDVIYIRECYNAHIPFRVVYNEYKSKISKKGLQNIWWFNT